MEFLNFIHFQLICTYINETSLIDCVNLVRFYGFYPYIHSVSFIFNEHACVYKCLHICEHTCVMVNIHMHI